MSCIEWIDTQISGLEAEIGVLKMQRKVLIDAQKERKLDELEAALAPKAVKLEPFSGGHVNPRKPRTGGVKDAVLGTIKMYDNGVETRDIIRELSKFESGSIRQALNGLKKRGEIMQDGKMWVMASAGMTNGAYAVEEMTA